MNVLFVDDDSDVLEALEMALYREPYAFKKALSAEEALSMLQKGDIDVMVTDEDMPGMRGADLLALARWKYPQVTRVLLTGRATVEATIRSVNEGQVYRVLTKPFETAKLAKVIRSALELKLMTETTRKIWRGATEQHDALRRFNDARERVDSERSARTSEGQSDLVAQYLLDQDPTAPTTSRPPDHRHRSLVRSGIDRLLTTREQEVLLALGSGLGAKEIAQRLGISHHTARNHAKAIYRKLGLHSRGELYVWLNEHLPSTA